MQKEQKKEQTKHDQESLVDNVIMAITKDEKNIEVILDKNMNDETAVLLVITLIETAQKIAEQFKRKGAPRA